ncbi:exo-alpha-sialidase, partial [Burkholderia cenocepacia]|uniref:exo-alpha-sialidase n=1 Tax=Burkholderia cenocepacia TaxID=95486 RepID=UPI0038CC10B2
LDVDGAMLALYRSRWADAIHVSRSSDHGRTWTAPEPTALPNNNSSVQWTPLADGRLAVVYNHVRADEGTARRLGLYDEIDEHGIVEGVEPAAPVQAAGAGRSAFWGTPRAPMSLATSSDGGETWTPRLTLDTGTGYCLSNNSRDGVNRELSYPSILQTADGTIHVAYTYWRQAIKHVRIDPLELDDA